METNQRGEEHLYLKDPWRVIQSRSIQALCIDVL